MIVDWKACNQANPHAHRSLQIQMSSNNITSDLNNAICEADGCFAKAKVSVAVKVGSKGTISLLLCENCRPRFSTDDTNHAKIGDAAN